jgi:ACS family hexuronate transporter-like MFS transporter
VTSIALRWWVLGIFVLSSAINYLDRQTLATLAPPLRQEFHLSYAEYGLILTAFSITYAACAPFAGLLIDRIGLHRAIALAIAVWSAASIATGLTTGLASLVVCRAVLGIAEAAGIPAAGKAIHQYLPPPERALGNAVNQMGVSLGLILAPPLATWIAIRHGWRAAFIVTGVLGLVWIPLWQRTSRLAPSAEPLKEPVMQHLALLRSPRLWAFVAANAVGMAGYSFWTNFTVSYLVDVHRLTLAAAARFSWIPFVFAALGGFSGGWLSLRWMKRGYAAVGARTQACLAAALLSLAGLAIPFMPTPAWSAAGISAAMFAVAAFSVNMYTLPLDTFGGARAAFAVSMLVAAYGGAQALISPLFGSLIDHYGFAPACRIAAITPLAAFGVLKWTE